MGEIIARGNVYHPPLVFERGVNPYRKIVRPTVLANTNSSSRTHVYFNTGLRYFCPMGFNVSKVRNVLEPLCNFIKVAQMIIFNMQMTPDNCLEYSKLCKTPHSHDRGLMLENKGVGFCHVWISSDHPHSTV